MFLTLQSLRHRYTAWFNLWKYILFSMLLIILVFLIDYRLIDIIDHVPVLLTSPLRLAKNILTSLAGAFLTITTFGFTTVLTVLNIYVSNYTPSMLDSFLEQKATMRVIGMFSGGFVYCITMLFFLRESDEGMLVIAGAVGVIFSLVALFYFIIFVQVVMQSIRPGALMERITKEARASIAKSVDNHNQINALQVDHSTVYTAEIPAVTTGFLEAWHSESLFEVLFGQTAQCYINPMIGDHINEGDTLAEIYSIHPCSEEDLTALSKAFLVDSKKNIDLDYHFGIVQLVEMAMRAISPGINDPNTAISCIYRLGDILGDIAQVQPLPKVEEEGNIQIISRDFDLQIELQSTFEQLIHYGRQDISVVRAIFLALQVIYDRAVSENKPIVQDYSTAMYGAVQEHFRIDAQQQELMRLHQLHVSNADRRTKQAAAQ